MVTLHSIIFLFLDPHRSYKVIFYSFCDTPHTISVKKRPTRNRQIKGRKALEVRTDKLSIIMTLFKKFRNFGSYPNVFVTAKCTEQEHVTCRMNGVFV